MQYLHFSYCSNSFDQYFSLFSSELIDKYFDFILNSPSSLLSLWLQTIFIEWNGFNYKLNIIMKESMGWRTLINFNLMKINSPERKWKYLLTFSSQMCFCFHRRWRENYDFMDGKFLIKVLVMEAFFWYLEDLQT